MCFLPRGVKQCELGIVVADVRRDIATWELTVNPINKYVDD